MNVKDLAEQFYKLARSLALDPNSEAYKLLLFIDKLPSHCIYEEDITEEQRPGIEMLTRQGYLRFVPEGHSVISDKYYQKTIVPVNSTSPRYRARYVVTGTGSYGLDTFKFDTLREEGY